jgi:nucleotide-binding universal stress UspA family protein
MEPYPTVIAGTDGSPTARRAVVRAALVADALDTLLLVATAFTHARSGAPPADLVPRGMDSARDANAAAAGDVAAAALDIVRSVAPDLDVDTATPHGEPADALLDLAESRAGALLVVGNVGMSRSRRFVLGSVPNKISHHAPGDLLIAHTTTDAPVQPYERLLVATDGSHTATHALERGLSLARAVGAAVTVVTVHDDETDAARVLDDAGGRARAAGVEHRTVALRGDPAQAILDAGERHELVVVGNKGMTGARRFLLGSVPNKISHHVGVDLLIVKTS